MWKPRWLRPGDAVLWLPYIVSSWMRSFNIWSISYQTYKTLLVPTYFWWCRKKRGFTGVRGLRIDEEGVVSNRKAATSREILQADPSIVPWVGIRVVWRHFLSETMAVTWDLSVKRRDQESWEKWLQVRDWKVISQQAWRGRVAIIYSFNEWIHWTLCV